MMKFKSISRKTMFRMLIVICCAILTALLSGCGGQRASGGSADLMAADSVPSGWSGGSRAEDYANSAASESAELPEAAEAAGGGGGGSVDSGSVYRNHDTKLIRRAEITIRTEEFDKAVAGLEEMVTGAGGYFQDAFLYNDSYNQVNANRSGEYTIRVPAENYDSFLAKTGELGYISRQRESTEDIGEQYYDTESRLRTQQTKQQRLQELMAQAESMEDIIELENALSDVEYQIDQLSSELNRYNSLVGFATIQLELMEEGRVSPETGTGNSLPERMGAAFSESVDDLIDGFQDVLVWCSYNLIGLIVFIIIVVVCVAVIRRIYRKHARKKAESAEAVNIGEAYNSGSADGDGAENGNIS